MNDSEAIGSFIQSLTQPNTFLYTGAIAGIDRTCGGDRGGDRIDFNLIVDGLDDTNTNPNGSIT